MCMNMKCYTAEIKDSTTDQLSYVRFIFKADKLYSSKMKITGKNKRKKKLKQEVRHQGRLITQQY